MSMRLALVAAAAGVSVPAFAHTGHAGMAGFMHPLTGLDHVLAMISVGVWAALSAGRAMWLVPGVFLVSLVAGFALAVGGIGLPGVEPGIAASVFVLGVLVAAGRRLPLGASMGLVGWFAILHGHAHGAEVIAGNAGAASTFGLGFVVTSALLHLTGIALAQALRGSRHVMLVRGFGGGVAACGLVFLGGAT